jgi:hypothetical protein
MPTINTGTTALTTVLIDGDDVNVNAQQIFVYEQTSAGSPTPANSILLGNTTTTPGGGAFGGADENGENFALVVGLSGLTSYTLGATGAAGDIYFVASNGNIILKAPEQNSLTEAAG